MNKFCVKHIDSDEVRYFKTKDKALFWIECSSGYHIEKCEVQK